jgi:hypothetical protein
VAPETIVMNTVRGMGGHFAALPPMCVTLGMEECLGARRLYDRVVVTFAETRRVGQAPAARRRASTTGIAITWILGGTARR